MEINGDARFVRLNARDGVFLVVDETTPSKCRLMHTETRETVYARTEQLNYAPAPENASGLKREEWERIIFTSSVLYRVALPTKPGRPGHNEAFDTFPKAVIAASHWERLGHFACIYCVTARGRSFPLGGREWPVYLSLWRSLPGIKSKRQRETLDVPPPKTKHRETLAPDRGRLK
jgi:hypothetical protein